MKKLFVTAMAAAVAFFSTSAFAFFCDGISWNCPDDAAKCGKAYIEVIEMVRANAACGFEFVESDCAAAMGGENVYFAVRLTVPEDVNPDWWAKTAIQLKGWKIAAGNAAADTAWNPVAAPVDVDGKLLGAGTYWLTNAADSGDATLIPANIDPANGPTTGDALAATRWTKVAAGFEFDVENVFSFAAARSNAKVCARLLTAGDDGFTGLNEWMTVGPYKVMFVKNDADDKADGFFIAKDSYLAYAALDKPDGEVVTVEVAAGDEAVATVAEPDRDWVTYMFAFIPETRLYVGYWLADGSKFQVQTTVAGASADDPDIITYSGEAVTCGEAKFVKDAMDFFSFDFGTCITYKAVKKTFGFGGLNDVVQDCTGYKAGTYAIVDAACEIEIPKTGGASALGYALAAIIAAFGAMLRKK